MKINMVTPWKAICGNATYAKRLVPHLRKHADIKIIEIKEPYTRNPLEFYRLARKACVDCDLIHVQHAYGVFGRLLFSGAYAFLFYSMLRGNKIMTTIHDAGECDAKGIIGVSRAVYRRIIDYPMLKKSDIIHVHSDSSRDILVKRGIDPSKILVSPLGIFDSSRSKHQKTADKSKKTITLFGFIHRNKGHDIALKALAKLPEKYNMLIAGQAQDDDYLSELKEMSISIGIEKRVIFRSPFRESEIGRIFSRTDILALPYRHVSQSSVMDMGLSRLLPVVTSDIPFFSEIKNKWDCILTFREGIPSDFAEKIRSLEGERVRRQLTANMRRYIEANSADKICRTIAEAYYKIISRQF